MPREVADAEGIRWSCIQAFAGLGKDAEKTEAARVEGAGNRFHVVCTPSGGAKSVRVELPGHWEKGLSDEELLRAIQDQLARDGA
ncbi:hypothetical protein SAMN05444354_105175 [Stigmatella aurantiaca]|uniref:Uncharacterized protein n=1 Tax=Stigmatella aurantiaca TaxID=41 RepID=A0A1H7P6I2_STIAU|nr:hypothetical protein [Stigmatella aurantiaca]SEL30687.1 hypothetical protein SAMN05444354_105175 [Stigmatella aurantiaca]